ncbi:unnamed protein product [Adineta steineri]|uniref:tRNA synthetases class I catalytic domain-containing protein n=1 Tax=Adineta steineri TaxID=433720 RepID=A0A816D7Z0_9BILA|nr:unnamed protein product [Adineta steineri]CAF1629627.1 unnamed protein product [Adineta steineri]
METELFNDCNNIFSSYLDSNYPDTINQIDSEGLVELRHPFEQKFNDYMKELNIISPNFIPHSSDHLPGVVEFIKKITENGFGYGCRYDLTEVSTTTLAANHYDIDFGSHDFEDGHNNTEPISK